MDDVTTTTQAPLSTELETSIATSPSGGGIPKTLTEPVPDTKAPGKVESVRASLEAEAKNLTERERRAEKGEKVEEADKEADVKVADKSEKVLTVKDGVKVEKPVKAEELAKDPADKGAVEEKPDAAEQGKEQAERKSESRDRPEPPARFLPKAKEVWKATPAAVQAEVARMAQEHETEVSQYRESHQFRQELKEFEDLAKASNTTVKQALHNYVEIEKKFSHSPHEGFRELLANIKMQPAQAIGAILQAYNVSPQALAAHLTQSPEVYSPLAPRQAPEQAQQTQQQQPNPELEQLKQKIQQMEIQTVTATYIQPFMAAHPRYTELEGDIAFFLNSGKIPTSLSPAERLEAAYDMAERINPSSSHVETAQDDDNSSRVDAQNFNGTKSVKSSPGNVLDIAPLERKMSMRELLEDELRRSKRA